MTHDMSVSRQEELRDTLMRTRSKIRYLTEATEKLLMDDDPLYEEHAQRLRRSCSLRNRLKLRLANSQLVLWKPVEQRATEPVAIKPVPVRPVGRLARLVLEMLGRAA